MTEAEFLVDGPGVNGVGRVAEQLHQSFTGVLECPQQLLPELAGRRLFCVRYSDIDARDVETIRQELGEALHTQAWSCKLGDNGKYVFYPERTGASAFPRPPVQPDEDDPPPDYEDCSGDPYAGDPYGDDSSDDDSDDDWEWDYFVPPPHHGHGRPSSPNAYYGGRGYGDYPDPHSHSSHGRTSFATDYDHYDRYDNYFEPPLFGNNRRHTFPRGYEDPFGYEERFGPPLPRHDRRNPTFPRNYGPEYPYHQSRGHPSRSPYENRHIPQPIYHNQAHHYHSPTHGPPRNRRPSRPDPYDRASMYPGPLPYGDHFPSSSGHRSSGHRRDRYAGDDRMVPWTPSRASRPAGVRKRISRKLKKMVFSFMMYAMT